jgi:putative hemolysin
MNLVAAELALILALLLANGAFAMTEIALVSARRSRLRQRADAGSAGAKAALALLEAPNRFLSAVQVGITLVGILAGAFGGAHMAERLAAWLREVPFLAGAADPLAFGAVISALTFLSLVIGELAPKRLALRNPEGISIAMALPMRWLANAASPVVSLLTASTDGLLRAFGIKGEPSQQVTREEVGVLVREGVLAGAFGTSESRIIEEALHLADVRVGQIMVPYPRLEWVEADEPHAGSWRRLAASSSSFFPVRSKEGDEPLGVVSLRSLYACLAEGRQPRFEEIVTQPLFVPEQQNAVRLLETFRGSPVQVALVVDEFGRTVGMVTLAEVLEAVLGEIPKSDAATPRDWVRRADGSFLADGIADLEKIAADLEGFALPEGTGSDFQTLAGYVMWRLQRWPNEGDTVEHGPWILEVADIDGQRIDKILITPTRPGAPPAAPVKPPGA